VVDLTDTPAPPSSPDEHAPSHDRDAPTTLHVAERVVSLAALVVPCDAAGIEVHDAVAAGHAHVANGEPARRALVLRRLHDGPDVASTDHVLVADTAAETRWPAWGGGLADLGLRSVVVVPLSATGRSFGVLELSARRPHAFDGDALARALELGVLASVALAAAHDRDGLRRAVDARSLIGIAMGVLVERYDLAPDAAFQVLVRLSQHHNVKLREVARMLVEDGALPDEAMLDQP
jgi:GAF domain-containing protein